MFRFSRPCPSLVPATNGLWQESVPAPPLHHHIITTMVVYVSQWLCMCHNGCVCVTMVVSVSEVIEWEVTFFIPIPKKWLQLLFESSLKIFTLTPACSTLKTFKHEVDPCVAQGVFGTTWPFGPCYWCAEVYFLFCYAGVFTMIATCGPMSAGRRSICASQLSLFAEILPKICQTEL